MKVLVLIANPCVNDARVIREAEALVDAGHSVVVHAAWQLGLPAEEVRNGVIYRRKPLRSADQWQKANETNGLPPEGIDAARGGRSWGRPDAYLLIRRMARVLRALVRGALTSTTIELARNAYYFRSVPSDAPDVIHAHELATLLAGSRLARQTGAKLVYDSHEFETGRNGVWGAWELWLRERAERWLIRRADRVITVSDSIAERLAAMYEIETPTVILNAPLARPSPVAGGPGRNLRADLELEPTAALAVYVGKLTRNRGLEQSVECLVHAPEVHLAAVGPREPDIEQKLRGLARRLGVAQRMHIVDPVPHEEVTSYVSSAGVSLILIQDACLSYRYCFPNKLLESLLAGVPIVAARLVELERMMERTGAGLVVDQTDPRSIAEGIRAVLANRARFAPDAQRIKEIADTFGWDVQRQRLLDLYNGLRSDVRR